MAPEPVVPVAGPLPFITSSAIDPDQVRREARREQLVFGSAGIADRLAGETDPPYIRDAESFMGWPHKAIFEKVTTMNPGAVAAVAQKAAKISQVEIGWHLLALKRVIGAKWGGTAADAATAAVDAIHGAGADLTTAITDVSARLELVSNLGSELKIAVPAPEVPKETLSGSEAAAARARMEDERIRAAGVLDNVYLAGYEMAGTGVPALPGPSAIAGPSGGWGPGIGSPISVSNSSNTDPSGVPGSGDPSAPGDGNADPTATQAANAAPTGAAPATGQQSGQDSGSGSPASTTAASAQNSTNPAAYGSTGGGGYAGSGSGRGTDRRSGSGSGGSGTDSGVSGFAAGPMAGALGGAAGGAAATTAAAPAARAATGRPMGMPMGMPMGGAGRGAGGSDDTEHKRPSYLINMDNGNELIGKIDPVAPPVIGA